jgi:hypothetical protein
VATPDLKKVKISEIPLNKNNLAICDIYIRMPSQNRYIKFLSEGDPLDNRKKTLLQRHVDPFAYIPNSGATQSADSVAETLSAESEQKLKELYKNIFSPDMSPEEGFKRIESTAEDILNLVAPETKDLKAHLLKNLKYLDLMNDVSAITTIATFVAFSSGFDSKKSYRDLTYACLVMDSSMSEFTDEEVKMYYRDPNSLPPDIAARFKKHPARSHAECACPCTCRGGCSTGRWCGCGACVGCHRADGRGHRAARGAVAATGRRVIHGLVACLDGRDRDAAGSARLHLRGFASIRVLAGADNNSTQLEGHAHENDRQGSGWCGSGVGTWHCCRQRKRADARGDTGE